MTKKSKKSKKKEIPDYKKIMLISIGFIIITIAACWDYFSLNDVLNNRIYQVKINNKYLNCEFKDYSKNSLTINETLTFTLSCSTTSLWRDVNINYGQEIMPVYKNNATVLIVPENNESGKYSWKIMVTPKTKGVLEFSLKKGSISDIKGHTNDKLNTKKIAVR